MGRGLGACYGYAVRSRLLFAAAALATALAALAVMARAPGPGRAEPSLGGERREATESLPVADEPRARAPVSPRSVPRLPPTDSESERRGDETERGAGAAGIPPPRPTAPTSAEGERRYEVSRIYNRREFEAARDAALDVLEDEPGDRRMLRIAASSACILGDRDIAESLASRMNAGDREELIRRCERHGLELFR